MKEEKRPKIRFGDLAVVVSVFEGRTKVSSHRYGILDICRFVFDKAANWPPRNSYMG